LKEFIPGKMIQFSESSKPSEDYSMKLACLDGSIRYMVDKKFGYAKVNLSQRLPNLPYLLTGFTHSGREIILIQSLDRENTEGNISRTFESVALQLTLKDLDKNDRYRYTISCGPSEAVPATYEEIAQKYGDKIVQDDVDNIVNGEVKYFIWADPGYWGFVVLPILRDKDQLKIGKEQFKAFENEHWVSNYFDGTR
jgi:thiol-disulfide isomerase/thioredoxin